MTMKHFRAFLGTTGFALWLILLLFMTGVLLNDGKSPKPWPLSFSYWFDQGEGPIHRLRPYFTAEYKQ